MLLKILHQIHNDHEYYQISENTVIKPLQKLGTTNFSEDSHNQNPWRYKLETIFEPREKDHRKTL